MAEEIKKVSTITPAQSVLIGAVSALFFTIIAYYGGYKVAYQLGQNSMVSPVCIDTGLGNCPVSQVEEIDLPDTTEGWVKYQITMLQSSGSLTNTYIEFMAPKDGKIALVGHDGQSEIYEFAYGEVVIEFSPPPHLTYTTQFQQVTELTGSTVEDLYRIEMKDSDVHYYSNLVKRDEIVCENEINAQTSYGGGGESASDPSAMYAPCGSEQPYIYGQGYGSFTVSYEGDEVSFVDMILEDIEFYAEQETL